MKFNKWSGSISSIFGDKELRRRRKPFVHTFYERNHLMFLIAMATLLVNSALDVFIASIMQELLDTATGGTTQRILQLLFMAVIYAAVYFVTVLCANYTRNRFVRRALVQYKAYVFQRITEKSIRSFSDENTSRYISALTNDVASIEQNRLRAIFMFAARTLWFFGALGMMFWYDWSMTLVVIGLCMLPVLVSLAFGGRLVREEKAVSDRNEGFVGMVKDLLSGFTVIKSFKAEREVTKLFADENTELEQKKYRRQMTSATIDVFSYGAGALVQFGVFFYGAYLAVSGRITAGVVVAFVQLMNYVLTPVQTLPSLFANFKAADGLIDKLADAVESNTGRGGVRCGNELREGICIQNVTFGYDMQSPVLKDINVTFAAGKSYAVVGGSGSGKSTLLNLLLGSFDNYEGKVLFDGRELREISPESLYDIVSIIQQNVFVFDSSIRRNITMFREFDDAQVQDAIEKAGLTTLLNERGEDYQCGENGIGLSGGERQRISIARCLLRKTPVLLMDEATASLDAETAFAVTSSILDIEQLTRIIVTHRLEEKLLTRYDEIIVMRGGMICERGTFAELMARREYFYSLYMVSKADEAEENEKGHVKA